MPKKSSATNVLLYADESDANMMYATRFACPDPFIFIKTSRGRRIYVMSDLEIDRAKANSNAHRVLSLSDFTARARHKKGRTPKVAEVVAEVLRELRIRSVNVPINFPVAVADGLRELNVGVRVGPDPFFPKRLIKSDEEVKWIRQTMRTTEEGMAAAIDLIRSSRIKNGWLVHGGRRLTAERVRQAANEAIFARGCVPALTIVAPGKQACDPHEVGSGPIRANEPVIIDIFPRAERTGYFGDITRTVVKGKASDAVAKIYRTVLAGQRTGVKMIRHGTRCADVHDAILGFFATRGFQSGPIDGRMQGFFHGTGHGLGLEIHEPPRIGPGPAVLKAGMVVTVEPGLYYWPIGGVRIEDTVLVTKDGVKNLTRFPKFLEVD